MTTLPYLGVHYADHALVLSHKRQLIVLASRVIELADEAQSFVLSHDRSASSFQQVYHHSHHEEATEQHYLLCDLFHNCLLFVGYSLAPVRKLACTFAPAGKNNNARRMILRRNSCRQLPR